MSRDGDTVAHSWDHVAYFDHGDDELVDAVTAEMARSLRDGDLVLIVANARRVESFERALEEAGTDVAAMREHGRLIVIDAAAALTELMRGDRVDDAAFDHLIGTVVRRASATGRRVVVYGEMVANLWESGEVTATIELERLWDRLGQEISFSLHCGYPPGAVTDELAEALQAVRDLHSATVHGGLTPGTAESSARQEQRSFEASARAPRAARQFVAEVLRQWGQEEWIDDATLVVSELAANAVLHAGSPLAVVITERAGGVRISVADAARAAPVLQQPTSQPGGRGLVLVAALAAAWGSHITEGGKVVWAELRR